MSQATTAKTAQDSPGLLTVLDADRVAPFKDKPLKERFMLWPWGASPHWRAFK